MININLEELKAKNEQIILNHGAEICNWLGTIDQKDEIRNINEIIDRALILNAIINIHFQAPIHIINDWINRNDLSDKLTSKEKVLLSKKNEELTKQDSINLYWNIEALWALMWVGSLIKEIDFTKCIEDSMASLCPDLQKNEDGKKFKLRMKMRNINEILEMLDLHYRLHWYTEECRIAGKDSKGIDGSIIMERRKALEWVCDASLDWDNIDLNT